MHPRKVLNLICIYSILTISLSSRAIHERDADMTLHNMSIPISTSNSNSYTPISTYTSDPNSVTITLPTDSTAIDLTSLNDTIYQQKISDHSLEMQIVEGIPIYTWNAWAFGSPHGFSPTKELDLTKYEHGRFSEQVAIIKKIFQTHPNAILCLQEVTQPSKGFDYTEKLLSEFRKTSICAEYNKDTTGTSFGQMTLYNNSHYKPVREFKGNTKPVAHSTGAAAPFNSKTDTDQSNRVFKVYFEEVTGRKRQLAVVNAHLKWYDFYPNTERDKKITGIVSELVTYSPGDSGKEVLTVIAGDFNYDLKQYHSTDSRVTVSPVGNSYSWGKSGQNKKTTDGFIVIKP